VPSPGADAWHGSATTQDSLWFSDAPPIPQSFTVKWDRPTVTFGDLRMLVVTARSIDL
jgi:hypothetical protein